MKLKDEVIDRIRGKRKMWLRLCDELNTSREGLWRYLNLNSDNGKLTSYAVLKVISDFFSEPIDNLVTEEKEQEVA